MNDKQATTILSLREYPHRIALAEIGRQIGYGRAQQILGELWDDMLSAEYGVSARGAMGMTIDDALPPIPKAQAKRREMRPNGGYEMVPAYSVAELKAFAHATLVKHSANAQDK